MNCRNISCEFFRRSDCSKHDGLAKEQCSDYFYHLEHLDDIREGDTVSVISPFMSKDLKGGEFIPFNPGDRCIVCGISDGFCSLLRVSDRSFAKTIQVDYIKRL